jgi:type I restriction enzyme S subunit
LGLACRVPEGFEPGVIVADLIRINPSSKYINYDWLTFLINSNVVQNQFKAITKGTTRARMNLTIMRSVLMPLCSKNEQTEIVKRVENLFAKADAIEAQYQILKAKIDSLPQAVLAKAFKGELVPQLPADGDAKELLAEIQKLKEAALPSKKKIVKKKKIKA